MFCIINYWINLNYVHIKRKMYVKIINYLIVHYRKWFYHFLQRYTNNANITTNRQLNYKIYFMGWFQPWIHDFDSVKFKWRIGKTKMQMQSVICIINWKALFCLIMDWLKVCIVFAQIRQKQKWKPYAELYIGTVTWMQIANFRHA